jgi:recombination protein RecA
MAKKKEEQQEQSEDIYDKIAASLNKRFKPGTIIDLENVSEEFERVPSENLTLDWILGGGWPKGKIVEIYAMNGVGKTTFVIDTAIKFQKNDPRPILIVDAENKINLQYAKNLGLDTNKKRLIFSQDTTIEPLSEILEAYIEAGVSAIFIDSIAVMVSEREAEAELDPKTGSWKEDTGHKAKMLARFWRKIGPLANKHNTFIMCTNAIKFKPGGYGDPRYQPGGEETRNRAIIRLELSRNSEGKIKIGEEEIGHMIKVYAEKNQTAPPHRSSEIALTWGVGFNNDRALVDMAIFTDVIKYAAGGWCTFPNGQKVQGVDNCVQFLLNDQNLHEEIYRETRKQLGI